MTPEQREKLRLYEQTPKRREWKRAYDRKRARTPKRQAWRKIYMAGYSRKYLYGLSPANYDILLQDQGGVCAICKQPPPQYKKTNRLYVDHDHETQQVRGLLCQTCNLGLGYVEDPMWVQLAQFYLSRNGPPRAQGSIVP